MREGRKGLRPCSATATKEGRFDGENSDYGLVDIRDDAYREFVEAVKQASAAALDAHKRAGK